MAASRLPFVGRSNEFYRRYYQSIIVILIAVMVLTVMTAFLILYQISHRERPTFSAISPAGHRLELVASDTPNLLSSTIIKWARRAAVAAYTFNFVNYEEQLALARPYFTESGWQDYYNSVTGLLQTIKQNQLFVNGVVVNPPVISNEGDLPGLGFVWRVQIPFLVVYQTAETSTPKNVTAILSIVKVPTTTNPSGIGVGEFIMR